MIRLLAGGLTGLGCCLALLGSRPTAPAPAPLATLTSAPAALQGLGCEPLAPLAIELEGSSVAGDGSARLDYSLSPLTDAAAFEFELRLPEGGAVRWHDTPDSTPLGQGELRQGAARVVLPADAVGARAQLVVRMLLADGGSPDAVEWVERVETLSWGVLEQVVEQAELRVIDGEATMNIQGEWRPR